MDYITSKFYANSRYTSSIFYTLKFFFEKNTKHLRALDKLGSVYRSSKWVGLKLRNVNSASLLRWYLAAALGLILCYFIVNPSSFVPAVATSAVHTLTQSAWQLLQYWKVGSITLLPALIELVARRLLFEMLGNQMASLIFGRVTCAAYNGENASGGNWAIAEIDANRFSRLDPRRYFWPHMRSSSGTYVYRALEPQFIDRVRIKANSCLELNDYGGLNTLEESVKQTDPSLGLTYWDARSKTIQPLSVVIAWRKELDRKGYTEKNLRRTAYPGVISADRRVWAFALRKRCFAYYCPQLNYSSSGIWRHVKVTSPVPVPESRVIIQRWPPLEPKPFNDDCDESRAIIQKRLSLQPEPLGDDCDRILSFWPRPNSNKRVVRHFWSTPSAGRKIDYVQELTFTPPREVPVCRPRNLPRPVYRLRPAGAFRSLRQ